MNRKQFLRHLTVLVTALALTAGSALTPLRAESGKEVTVFAAASLVDAFKVLKKSFEAAHPGVTVTYNFAGSQQLRAQVEQGATPDVFASANVDEIKALAAKKFVDETQSKIFARNKLVIAVNAQSDHAVKTPKDLATAGLKLVLADKSVPVGKYTVKYLDAVRHTQWFNALAAPAAVVPVGATPEGLPIGVQIVSRPFHDETALGVAAIVDAAFGYRTPPMAL